MSLKLTDNQRSVLTCLERFGADGFHPSSYMRNRNLANPGPVLKRLADRGLVEAGITLPEGRCYKITDAGRAALQEARKE